MMLAAIMYPVECLAILVTSIFYRPMHGLFSQEKEDNIEGTNQQIFVS